MKRAVAARTSWLSQGKMRAGDPHVAGLCLVQADCWVELWPRPASRRVGLRLRDGQRCATVGPRWRGRQHLAGVRQGAHTVAHQAKKPATAGAGRAEGWVHATT